MQFKIGDLVSIISSISQDVHYKPPALIVNAYEGEPKIFLNNEKMNTLLHKTAVSKYSEKMNTLFEAKCHRRTLKTVKNFENARILAMVSGMLATVCDILPHNCRKMTELYIFGMKFGFYGV